MDNYGDGRPSVTKTAKALFKENGWLGFYRGFGPRFLNMSLYGTSMIVTYELISESISPLSMIEFHLRISHFATTSFLIENIYRHVGQGMVLETTSFAVLFGLIVTFVFSSNRRRSNKL